MGKVFGAFMRLIVTLVLLGLLAYNTWEISQLRAEVDALKHHSSAAGGKTAIAPEKNGGAGGGDPISLMASAKQHADAARAHLERKEYKEASQEMALSAEAARKASADAGAIGEDRFAALKKTISSIQDQTNTLLKSHGDDKPASSDNKGSSGSDDAR